MADNNNNNNTRKLDYSKVSRWVSVCACKKVDSLNYTPVRIITILPTDFSVLNVTQLIRLSSLLIKIKEEPIDEEYNQSLPSSISTEDIKDEPNVAKVGHMIPEHKACILCVHHHKTDV